MFPLEGLNRIKKLKAIIKLKIHGIPWKWATIIEVRFNHTFSLSCVRRGQVLPQLISKDLQIKLS